MRAVGAAVLALLLACQAKVSGGGGGTGAGEFDGQRAFGYQLPVGGLDRFRQEGGKLAGAASETENMSAVGGAALFLGLRANATYAKSHSVTWVLRTDQQVPVRSRSLEWPSGTISWSIVPPRSSIGRVLTSITAQLGYRERAHWSEEGWEWRSRNAIEKPRFWDDPEWSAYLGPDQPVVGVSWYEADAFARSLGMRLPTEAEWERAARGDDGRIYPWGDEWVPEYAVHRGGKRHTLPVGSIPENRSPHGLLDCAGNVWEWCSDWFS